MRWNADYGGSSGTTTIRLAYAAAWACFQLLGVSSGPRLPNPANHSFVNTLRPVICQFLQPQLYLVLGRYVLLEDPDIQGRERSDPRSFIEGLHPPVIFDEIQNTPELRNYVVWDKFAKQAISRGRMSYLGGVGSDTGIRTRILALRGPRPNP